ncbi:hypothetical protein ABZ905_26230 [Streptomyces parvus]|uniref:hypothetical protein n=1 Tax=Streptomyces parvus TaxID=66428 RepID=UPI0034075A39
MAGLGRGGCQDHSRLFLSRGQLSGTLRTRRLPLTSSALTHLGGSPRRPGSHLIGISGGVGAGLRSSALRVSEDRRGGRLALGADLLRPGGRCGDDLLGLAAGVGKELLGAHPGLGEDVVGIGSRGGGRVRTDPLGVRRRDVQETLPLRGGGLDDRGRLGTGVVHQRDRTGLAVGEGPRDLGGKVPKFGTAVGGGRDRADSQADRWHRLLGLGTLGGD